MKTDQDLTLSYRFGPCSVEHLIMQQELRLWFANTLRKIITPPPHFFGISVPHLVFVTVTNLFRFFIDRDTLRGDESFRSEITFLRLKMFMQRE